MELYYSIRSAKNGSIVIPYSVVKCEKSINIIKFKFLTEQAPLQFPPPELLLWWNDPTGEMNPLQK